MENSTRRGPSGLFMALLGICALALLVVIIYGVAVSNPDLVKRLMGVEDAGAADMYGEGPYGDGMYYGEYGDGAFAGEYGDYDDGAFAGEYDGYGDGAFAGEYGDYDDGASAGEYGEYGEGELAEGDGGLAEGGDALIQPRTGEDEPSADEEGALSSSAVAVG